MGKKVYERPVFRLNMIRLFCQIRSNTMHRLVILKNYKKLEIQNKMARAISLFMWPMCDINTSYQLRISLQMERLDRHVGNIHLVK